MSSEHGSYSSFTRGYGGGRGRPDLGNRYYVRGDSRGRGGGSSATPPSFPPEDDIKKGLDTSKVIETIPAPPRPSPPEDIPIENVQYVASYNWVDSEQPTVVVPGTSVLPPPVLKDITDSCRVPGPTQVRPVCGLGVRSLSPCSPTSAPIL
jgi:hypothetical protein